MSTYSLEQLLKKLDQVPVTQGWGAVAAFSRDRVNQMLEQQFTAAFTVTRFIPPCSGEVAPAQGGAAPLLLHDIVLGAPVLSFERAQAGKAFATLTIPLLAGRYEVVEQRIARSPSRISSSSIDSDSIATLMLDIDLEQVNSDSDNTGRVAIDLGKASNPRCDLVGDPVWQASVGEFLLGHLRAQPSHKTTYVLGLVDAGNYAALNPVRFAICTQAAPGSTLPGASNAGDGAVLLLMKLRAYDNDQTLMPGAAFPYLLPNDTVGGVPVYTASLFICHELKGFVNDANLAVLKNSMLPAGYTFVEASGGRYQPFDTAIFGRLEATQDNVWIEPRFTDLKMLASQDFTVRSGEGGTVPSVTWSSGCLNSPLLRGQMSAGGRFSATGYPFAGPPVLMTTVSGQYTRDGVMHQASAFVLVRYQPLAVDPLVSSMAPGDAPVRLTTVGNDVDAGVDWSLLAPALGQVQGADPGQAQYTPPPAGGMPLVVQRVQARNDAKKAAAQAAVMLVADPETLPVQPPFVGSVFGQQEVLFEVPEAVVRQRLAEANAGDDDFVLWRWSVVGEGSVEGNGRTARFIPPATRSAETALSIVVCEMIGPAVDHICGYATVELAAQASAQERPRWKDIQEFRLTAEDGSQAYANGMQQVRVRIRIETKSVDIDGEKVHIPISEVEKASIRLMHVDTGAEVPFIDATQDGLEHDDTRAWAASVARNRFNYFSTTLAAEADIPLPTSEPGVVYHELFVHLKTDASTEFYAVFQSELGEMISSLGGEHVGKVTLKGEQPPSPGQADYQFTRERVWNGNSSPVPDDDFTFILNSIDFWTLEYRPSDFETIYFATMRIEGNTSTIQWESELLDEIFFSCTGYAFTARHREPVVPAERLSFDPYLEGMMNEVKHIQPDTDFHNRTPTPGTLLVSLHRKSDVTYWHDNMADNTIMKLFRKALDGPVTYTLRDVNGNRHNLQIGFKDRSIQDSRNSLDLIRQ